MDSTLALAITKAILEEINKTEEVPKDASKEIPKRTSRKTIRVTAKKQEKKSDGDNSNC